MNTKLKLSEIFDLNDAIKLELQLRDYLIRKRQTARISLTIVESVFEDLASMGGQIVGDGFISVYHECFSPETFGRVCEALSEVGGEKIRSLLLEAWHIYTNGSESISHEEWDSIPLDSFNTEEKMDRFDEIGEEVVAEIQACYGSGKIWSVEYAKRHRDGFEPIEE